MYVFIKAGECKSDHFHGLSNDYFITIFKLGCEINLATRNIVKKIYVQVNENMFVMSDMRNKKRNKKKLDLFVLWCQVILCFIYSLTSCLSFVMSKCEVVTFPLVSWVRRGA